jgi:hypothetical protein
MIRKTIRPLIWNAAAMQPPLIPACRELPARMVEGCSHRGRTAHRDKRSAFRHPCILCGSTG